MSPLTADELRAKAAAYLREASEHDADRDALRELADRLEAEPEPDLVVNTEYGLRVEGGAIVAMAVTQPERLIDGGETVYVRECSGWRLLADRGAS
jgi:hypothetical protein